MKRVVVEAFGGPEQLKVLEEPTPEPGVGQVRVGLTSIGMNHAELMAREGKYKLASGDPPFTPGLEGGGVIEAVGEGVSPERVGQRVVIGVDAPRLATGAAGGGTYRSHYVCPASQALPAPDNLPDEQLGTLWLAYLTAWGCLIWKQQLKPGQTVAMPAASSAVAIAAAQIAKRLGCTTIGITRRPSKAQRIAQEPTAVYDHLVTTLDENDEPRKWRADLKQITEGKGVDVFFDPVGGGDHLQQEILSLAQHGTIWVYGLLGEVGPVDVTPLIRKFAAVRGWALTELALAGPSAFEPGYHSILDGVARGVFRLPIAGTFKLDEVAQAHEQMKKGAHLGKLVMVP